MKTSIKRPLEKVKQLIEYAQFEISYAYDDLIFVNHNAFILQFDDENIENIKLFFNTECDSNESKLIFETMKSACEKNNFTISESGTYTLNEKKETQELELIFQV